LVITIGFVACGQQNDPTAKTEDVATSDVTLKRVDKVEFKSQLSALADVQLIDVRTPSEYAAGHMDEAVNIDFKNGNFKAEISKLDLNKPTMIYCHGGGRSAAALKQMKEIGFKHVLELEGGFSKW